ncbi:nickel/cobalt ABC transporter permease [Desulfonatronum sp. SC1]|uniref:nickel/cobalt ABC transporter permease n=1 Tax=Desulfonatronum sp. SC1 TaxID=2109626 RepID=UPI000D310492|nr:nickel/cobalt ABC transporter permease [Desulfonatronum sp. SC1]PTN38627.1 nickel ABC transporter permease subunit NikC [Desulfonatronum sp. SC1]
MRSLLANKVAVGCLALIGLFCVAGVFAPWLAPHAPNQIDVINSLASPSWEYPFGTDHLGRCLLSRMLFGIRITLFYSMLTMAVTALCGAAIGVISGYVRGKLDELIMRVCDVMLSFPYEIMVLCIVGILGPGLMNIVIANFIAKLAWYVKMIRSSVISFSSKNYILYSQTIGTSRRYIFFRHLFPNVASETILLATLDIGWIIITISTLSFLGLGVQLPTAEWGAMLSEAREVLMTNPGQMIIPGLAIMIVVAAFNLLGDSLRDILDPKESQ